ncbi:MAG: hypothetical protein IT379_27385 [Deltaproteobacteria bacterium]|nr:hypothetical protein [Deltaproteobacteria bacterium]
MSARAPRWACAMAALVPSALLACEGARTLPPCPAGTERAANGDCVLVARDAGVEAAAPGMDAGSDATAPDAGSEMDAMRPADAAGLDARVDALDVEVDARTADGEPDLGCRCACTPGAMTTIGAATAEVSSPRVVARPGGLAFAWRAQADGHVHLALGDDTAASLRDGDLGALGLEPSLVVTSDGLAIATRNGTGSSIATQRLDAAATPVGMAGVLTVRGAREVALSARGDGGLALVWLGDGAAHLAMLDADGREMRRVPVASVADAAPELAAARGADRTLVAWSDEATVWAAVVEDDGRVGGAVSLTESGVLGRVREVSASASGGGFVVAWAADVVDPLDVLVDEGDQIVAARVGLDGRPSGARVEVARTSDPDVVWPTVAVASGDRDVAIAWAEGGELVLARLSMDLDPWGAPLRTAALDDIDEVFLAAVGGGYAAAWSGGRTGLGFARFGCAE